MLAGGAAANTRLWMTTGDAAVWRESVELPYGNGATVYNPAMVVRKGGQLHIRRQLHI